MDRHLRRAMRSVLPALLVALAACHSAPAVGAGAQMPAMLPGESARADTERALLALMEEYKVPGIAASIVRDGEHLWSKGLGWADVEGGVPVRESTLFQLASISKVVTATVVLQLVERGALDLDADIGAVLPFSVRHPAHPDVPITARMLLTHTAAVRDDWDVLEGTWVHDRDYPLSLADSIAAYFRPGGAYYSSTRNFERFAPGVQHEYANVGFALLAYVAECAAGEPFERLVRERVLAPLDIEGGFRLADVELARVALPHEWEASTGFVATGHHAYLDFPSGTLRLSATGLARFVQAVQRGGALDGARILERATVDEMLRVQFPTIDDEQGLAWYTTTLDGQLHWGHDGSDPGVTTQMQLRMSEGVGVVLLMNGEPTDMAAEGAMLEILFDAAARMPAP